MMRRILIALVIGLIADVVFAQTACDDALQQARKSYDLGLFEDVAAQLEPCLRSKLSRGRATEVHSLMARAFLELDQNDQARREVSTILRLDPTFDATSPPRFAALVAEIRREEQTTQVASVSKTSESLREAPATVVVITAEEIARRGYLDLEQLLHDLPGFDVSRLNGDIYSNIYQRGYRSPNDRLLLLVDGVEQNELSSGILYLSRQFPLTNIDRVEVIYGPASTMYGANAYTGVISILTRDSEKAGFAASVAGGGYGALYTDVTAAGHDASGTVAWSLAANFQQSQERDLSRFADWDHSYRGFDYGGIRLTGSTAQTLFRNHCSTQTPFTQYFRCDNPNAMELSAAGANLVRDMDRALIEGQGLGFDDRATNWSLHGKLRISNLTVGLQNWRSKEGIGSQYRALDVSGDTNWTPKRSAIYLKYTVPLERVSLNLFTRYAQSGIDRDGSFFEYLHSYANGFLSPASLVPPCRALSDQIPQGCPAAPWVETVVFNSRSNQIRSEINVAYAPSATLQTVAGLELTKSAIQSQLDQSISGPGQKFHTVLTEPETIEHTDVAVYAQGAWKPRPSLKFVLAGRLTHNEINNQDGDSGFGTLFTPRAGVIWLPRRELVVKAIYSEAFKDPTDTQKFGRVAGVNDTVSTGLNPERVRNIELSAGWEPNENASFEGALYQAQYSDVVGLALAGCFTCRQFRNRDEIRIRGFQGTARYERWGAEMWANYTHTDPILTSSNAPLVDDAGQPTDHVRIADIASDRWNAGVDRLWRDRLRTGLRVHYTGARKTGLGTSDPDNPFREMDAHATVDAVVSESRLVPGATLQLIVYNLFDREYYDPAADAATGAPRVPQAGRTIYLRLVYSRF